MTARRPAPMAPIGRRALVASSVLVLATFLSVTLSLTYVAAQPIPPPLPGAPIAPNPSTKIEAVRTGIGAGASVGGACALLLAFRRQRHQEYAAQEARWNAEQAERDRARDMELREQEIANTAEDAKQRRITELYSKSIDQLGSTNSAVRLGGAYSLQRLADSESEQQQAVANVLCAYLRMPFETPDVEAWSDSFPDSPQPQSLVEGLREQQVRSAVQKMIENRLNRDDGPRFWNSIELDLSDARLQRFSIRNSSLTSARFNGARFTGDITYFHSVNFETHSSFAFCTFVSRTRFFSISFGANVTFYRASIGDGIEFHGCRFYGLAIFRELEGKDSSVLFRDCLIAPGDGLRRTILPDGWIVGSEDNAVGGGLLPIVRSK